MATLRISLLGGLSLTQEDQALPPLSPPKLVSLLACLLLHGEQAVLRDQLAAWLWPEEDKTEARANLRRHLHLLRQALPAGEWVLTERDTVQWNLNADFWLDVEEFSQVATRCLSPDPGQSCESCLTLYQGDLLPEVYDDWLIPERERLRHLYSQTLEAAIMYDTQRSEYAAALRHARRLLVYDPLYEETHRLAMRLYYLAGDRMAALHQFEECQALLRRELDVEPMPATIELWRTILEGRPLTNPLAPTQPLLAVESDIASLQGVYSVGQLTSVSPDEGLVSAQLSDQLSSKLVEYKGLDFRKRVLSRLGVLVVVILVVLVLVVFYINRLSTHPLSSVTISGPAVAQDTWITEDFPNDTYWPDDPDKTPHYRYSRAHLQYFDRHPKDRILVHFNLGGLPSNIKIEQAIFEVHLETWIALEGIGALTQSYPAFVSIYQILRPWQVEQATFNSPWSKPGLQPGVDVASTPLDTQSIAETVWLRFDVTDAARAWYRDPETNNGLMFDISSAPEDIAHYWVDMTDQPAATLRPLLVITYRRK
jgi:DNA-binding SARP family transcriptional activator